MATTISFESNVHLEELLSTNPKTEKALRKLIQQVLKEARDQVVSSIHGRITDPRGAANSVRRMAYKKILGGNLNIYNMKKRAGKRSTYEPRKKLQPGQVGGNRVPRGLNTQRWMSYGPHDRAAVLRWLSSGTDDREAGTRGGRLHGNRGHIAARNFFGPTADAALNRAADRLAELIDSELAAMLNK
jgi:hypothetical protein